VRLTELVSGEKFVELFRRFEQTAFRLEPRRRYNVEDEAEPYRRFLAGEDPGLDWLADWLDLMKHQTSQGKRVERVRVVDSSPSDYLRFMMWLTPQNIAAGEDIRYLERARAAEVGLPDYDYWLFDSRLVAKFEFTPDDVPLGVYLIDDPAEVVQHTYWRDVAWHYAEKLDKTTDE
jgi:hypothetical protein